MGWLSKDGLHCALAPSGRGRRIQVYIFLLVFVPAAITFTVNVDYLHRYFHVVYASFVCVGQERMGEGAPSSPKTSKPRKCILEAFTRPRKVRHQATLLS